MKAFPLFLRFLMTAAIAQAAAQPVSTQIEQARQFDRQITPAESAGDGGSLRPGEAPARDESEDLGTQVILKRQEKPKIFNLFGDVSALYTNNVALTRRDKFDDGLLISNFGGTAQTPLTETLEAEATVRGSIFRYGRFSHLDFDSLDAGGGLSWRMQRLWDINFFGRYNFASLFSAHGGDNFFHNHMLSVGLQRSFTFRDAHQFVVGYSSSFGFATPRASERDEHEAFISYHVNVTRHLEADLTYRFGYYVYSEDGRCDANQTVSLSCKYNFNRWLGVAAFTSCASNDSNRGSFDYSVVNAGGGAAVNLMF